MVDTTQTITTFAGNGNFGYCGDGGPATSACVYEPFGVAVDAAGNLFITQRTDSRVRKVDTTGIIGTLAGDGTRTFCGDGGPAMMSCVGGPYGAEVDAGGNLFVSDTYNHRIRRISSDQVLSIRIIASPARYSTVGQAISYSYLVANAGDLPLRGPFSVHDNRVAVTCPITETLQPGHSITCTGSHTITLADMETGQFTNVAKAVNESIHSALDTEIVTLLQTPTLTLDKTLVSGCVKTIATVTVVAPAPMGGTVVTLRSNNAHVRVRSSITVNYGTTSNRFQVFTSAVAGIETATLTATAGGESGSAALTLKPMGVKSVLLSPNPVVGGNPVTGTAALECAAGPGDIVVALGSTKPSVAAPVNASITIPRGTQSSTFAVATNRVAVASKSTIKASANGTTKSKNLTVNPGP
jgi:hypothetical protein